jgi:hypothetical protein
MERAEAVREIPQLVGQQTGDIDRPGYCAQTEGVYAATVRVLLGALRSCGAKATHPSNRTPRRARGSRWGVAIGRPHGEELWDTLQLWQSDNSESLTSAPTPSSAQNNVSCKLRKKLARSSRHSLNSVLLIEALALAVEVRARSRGDRSQRKAGTLGMAVGANERVAGGRCRRRHGRGLAKLRRRDGRS